MDNYKTGMGQRIRLRRHELKLTQEELAEKLGVSVKHYSEVERGLTGLSIENLVKLGEILGMSLDSIVKGEKCVSEWDSAVAYLTSVKSEKTELMKELINIGIELSK